MGLLSPIHVAIYEVLASGSPSVAGGRIYDAGNVPTVPTYPFVVFAAFRATRADDKGADADDGHGVDFSMRIEVYARDARGKKDAEEIMDAIYDALHDNPPAMGGSPSPGTIVTLACAEQGIDLEGDGLTTRGEQLFEGYAHT